MPHSSGNPVRSRIIVVHPFLDLEGKGDSDITDRDPGGWGLTILGRVGPWLCCSLLCHSIQYSAWHRLDRCKFNKTVMVTEIK